MTTPITAREKAPRSSPLRHGLAAVRGFALGFALAWVLGGADAAHALPIGQDPAGLPVGSLVILGGALGTLAVALRRHVGRRTLRRRPRVADAAALPRETNRRALQTPHFFLY